jgi:hypothetical protein
MRRFREIGYEESIYFGDYRDLLLDDDEISPHEAGFMEGYESAES